jgi:hypothetical protein
VRHEFRFVVALVSVLGWGTGWGPTGVLQKGSAPATQETGKQTIAELRSKFLGAQTKAERQSAAFDLVRLHDPDPRPWDYLVRLATETLEKDVPFPFGFDPTGRVVPRKFTAEFVRYCTERRVSPDQTAQEAMYTDPLDFLYLGHSQDPRTFPILQTALKARNYMVEVQAAAGLGRLRDKRAIPLIEEAAGRAPAEVAGLIARGLLFFDDTHALEAAERFIHDARYIEEFRRILREKGPEAVQ